jgi:hypothetical protein
MPVRPTGGSTSWLPSILLWQHIALDENAFRFLWASLSFIFFFVAVDVVATIMSRVRLLRKRAGKGLSNWF